MDVGVHRLQDIRLRDPFVLAARPERMYYLYGSTDANTWHGPGIGFDAFRSPDLDLWEGPFQVFAPPVGFWGKENFWAPEVYEVDGRFFMFATFRGTAGRGTAILAADRPLGPFVPHSDGAVTPRGWDALDGSLFVDDEGGRWLVYSHEWHQSIDGKVCARRLSDDLRTGLGPSSVLFTASQATWTLPIKERYHVADGPFLHRSGNGSLLMLWSSFGPFGYCQGIATSSTDQLFGSWVHCDAPIWEADGGHGMIFETFDRELRLILHHPNQTSYERALLLAVDEAGRELRLARSLSPLELVIRRFNRGGSRRQKLRFILHFTLRQLGRLLRSGAA